MKVIKLLSCLLFSICVISCRSGVQDQNDKLYSRHLQRNVELRIISTAMPSKKQDLNLLLFNDSKSMQKIRAKEIIDSLNKNKEIQPLLLIGISGLQGFYGMEEQEDSKAKQFKKYNNFIINELYPFAKKKTGIRKFNSVAICGYGAAAISSFDIAWNNDEKIGMVGMFEPELGRNANDSSTLQTIDGLRKRPNLKIWIAANENDSLSLRFKKMMDTKKSISDCTFKTGNDADFASFLLWAFPK